MWLLLDAKKNKETVIMQNVFLVVFYFFIFFFCTLFFNLPSFTPPVRATVGEVRYSIEIDVGGE